MNDINPTMIEQHGIVDKTRKLVSERSELETKRRKRQENAENSLKRGSLRTWSLQNYGHPCRKKDTSMSSLRE